MIFILLHECGVLCLFLDKAPPGQFRTSRAVLVAGVGTIPSPLRNLSLVHSLGTFLPLVVINFDLKSIMVWTDNRYCFYFLICWGCVLWPSMLCTERKSIENQTKNAYLAFWGWCWHLQLRLCCCQNLSWSLLVLISIIVLAPHRLHISLRV